MTSPPKTTPVAPEEQGRALRDFQPKTNQQQPRNFKEDALAALATMAVGVESDGTGPIPAQAADRRIACPCRDNAA
jgi:hypothetical protein